MKNILEFEKLAKVSIPYHPEFEYYITLLNKSMEHLGIKYYRAAFEDLELKHENVVKHKMQELDRLVAILEATKAYEAIQKYEPISLNVSNRNSIKDNLDKVFISFDIKEANFTALKQFDKANELKESWTDFCNTHNVHIALEKSKSFRQIVFGNLNPKRFQRVQHELVTLFHKNLVDNGLDQQICFVSHDEIVLAVESIEKAQDLMLQLHFGVPLHFRTNIYSLEHIKEDIFVKTHLKEDFSYKSLVGVPGNQYYIYFKKHILNEPLDKRDLIFINDKKLAMWVDDDINSL